MENVGDALDFGLQKLGYSQLREGQRKVVEAYLSGRDVFFFLFSNGIRQITLL